MATRAATLDFTPAVERRAPALSLIKTTGPDTAFAGFGSGRRTNWPVIGGIAAAHAALFALLTATGTIHLGAPPKAVTVVMVPNLIEPSPPPPAPDIPMEEVRPDIVVPDVQVEVPVKAVSPVQVTTLPPPQKVTQAPSVAVATPGPPVAAPVTPPDFDADQLNNPGPRYPILSRRNHEQGTATLKVLVSPDGRAQELAVATSSGFARLDAAALACVRDWKFIPAKQAGKPVAAWVLVPVTFALG